ncbi:DNA polymerase-3 subunit alpha [Anaeroplasma bactoclasticum]|uniref:DNA-directed DNA polymerase n=1 Tax=Anaeroplasma bactoclasticum TaxID=2088 RepID=A0A397S2N3_9MOLU|nr:DNA polymerase III subunit alpha [Anaeroplasma bactoclasticum]RIA78217.1 DNA polymerase-3 subunit alpha [Anaeroplasma bactoclasticum]
MKGFLYGQTEYNILKNSARLKDYLSMAKTNGFDFLSLTDSSMYACYKFYMGCQEMGIKPIIGLEYQMLDEDNFYSKCLLYAKNNEGYKELSRISSLVKLKNINSFLDIKDYKNIYFVFPFFESILERLFKQKNNDSNALNILNEYLDKINKIGGYIGLSYTNKLESIPLVREFSEYISKFNVKTLPLHQMKYIKPEDSIVYECLTKIDGKPEKISEFDDYSFLTNPKEDNNLNDFINSINLNLFQNKIALPHYPNTKGKSAYEYLGILCHKGLEKRGFYFEPYLSRLKYELSIIHKMGYDDYFLIVWDFICYSKKNHILVGPGRGSAVGSLVAYTLGITEINPLEYDLLFERFLNPERVTMPDIDTDFPDKDRDKVLNYVKEFYGEKHVCSITTFGTFQVKSSVNELAKIFGIDNERIKKILDMIQERGYDSLLEAYKGDELYDFLYCAKNLENLPKHIGTHASGIIFSEDNLEDIVPLSYGAGDLYQSQFEAEDLESIGLLKMDFLVVSHLSLIDQMIHDIKDYSIDQFRKIPLDDKEVFKLLRAGDTLGIFQMERQGFRNALKEVLPTSFNDIVALNALYRPGPMQSIPEYAKRKHGEKFEYLHKNLEPILKETYGVIVYQEQIMKIGQKFASYSLAEADILRRAVAKKKADVLKQMSSDFILRAMKNGYSKDIAEEIFELIYRFSDYGFNKSHSVAYALFAYKMLYIKAHYFNVFMSNIMNHAISNKTTLVSYISYAKSHGLLTQKPNINVSKDTFVFLDNWLYLPLKTIKGIGDNIVNDIVKERDANGLFRSFEDFIDRCHPDKNVLEGLVFSGALDIFGKTKKEMIESQDKQQQIYLKYIKGAKTKEEYDFDTLKEKEYQFLEMNLEYNLFINISEYYQKYKCIPLSKIGQKIYVNTIASFSDLKEIKTKKGDLMLLGSIEDDITTIRFTIFPKAYETIPYGAITKNKLYAMRGILETDNKGEPSFSISKLAPIE